ncbi:hypothetical protein LQL77_29640 [Rhodococcus cerastii]|nr:hypothetical protein [Rhodococcus cerastii]
MNLRHTSILGIAAFGAAAFFGPGIANATATPSDEVVSVTFNKTNGPTAMLATVAACDAAHPYVVLENEYRWNSSRIARRVTYRTGDGKPLDFRETLVPTSRWLSNSDGNFTDTEIFVQLVDSYLTDGHKSVTIFCSSTLEAAHQA